MAPLILEGDTLGQRHQHFNKLVKEAIAYKHKSESKTIDLNEGDIDNLLKIDVANNTRDVEYILQVLKCEDMLYVSRAIKRCTWLITDKQFAYIVNPQYLHTQLFPEMTVKSKIKFILHVRLNLKDEVRVEEFFTYYKEDDSLQSALKWLPGCSVSFIENVVENHVYDISMSLLKRICKKSSSIFVTFSRKYDRYMRDVLNTTIFILNTPDAEKYLDAVEKVQYYEKPNFNKKFTKILVVKYPHRILNNFEKYARDIDMDTFAKYFKKENIQEFLSKHMYDKDIIRSFCTFDNLAPLIKRMPKEGRFEFIKQVFIDDKHKTCNNSDDCNICLLRKNIINNDLSDAANVRQWYQFAPFDVAFSELKKYINLEKSQIEKYLILDILLKCAGHNMEHIHSLLQYYHNIHVKDPFENKYAFINKVLVETDTHKYNENTWSILDNIFKTMDVYIKSDNSAQNCVECIITYKIIHNEKVPEIIEEKFQGYNTTLQELERKLNSEQKEKIFNYLYSFKFKKVENRNITNKEEFEEAITSLESVLNILSDWKKRLSDYPQVMNKIKEYIHIEIESSVYNRLASLYKKNKSWRKDLFEESLELCPSEEVCLNVLKHDPNLLERSKKKLELMRCDDAVFLKRLLSKLRIYWPQSMAVEWTAYYRGRLDKLGGHKAVTSGICTLLPLTQVLEIVTTYTPQEPKINWDEVNEVVLSLQRNFAKTMHFARPQPPPDAILGYAKGDYLQYALPSVHAIFYNLSPFSCREHILKLLDSPVSLQKHGIRFAFRKLSTEELKPLFSNLWKNSKNSTIRAVLFKLTYTLLCREKNPTIIKEVWQLLEVFIDNLSYKEDKNIYEMLTKIDPVPLTVKANYLVKSYRFLKKLLAENNKSYEELKSSLHNLAEYTREVMESLESDFVLDLLQEFINEKFIKEEIKYYENNLIRVMGAYVLCVKDEESQIQKYEKFLLPLLDRCFMSWKEMHDGKYFIRCNTYALLNCLSKDLRMYVISKDLWIPTKMFINIQDELEKSLLVQENYVPLTKWKLTAALAQIVATNGGEVIDDEVVKKKRFSKIATDFGTNCLRHLKEDIERYFPYIYVLFSRALQDVSDDLLCDEEPFEMYEKMLEDKDFIPAYLVVIKILPRDCRYDNAKNEKMKHIRKIILSHPSVEVKMHFYHKYKSEEDEDTE